MKTIQAFGCDYCAMTSRRKSSVIRHEIYSCRKNTNRVACSLCSNLEDDADGRHCSEGAADFMWDSVNENRICDKFESILKAV